MSTTAGVVWPFLKELPVQMSHTLNLHAERRMCQVGDNTALNKTAKGAAILILHGQANLLDEHGEVTSEMTAGQCFNEQILIGMTDPCMLWASKRFVP